MKWIVTPLFAFLFWGCGGSETRRENPNVTTWRSMLSAAADIRASVAGESRLFSSASGPVSLTGYAVKTHGDLDHGNFLEVRDVEGGVEAVLAEMNGSGAITWIWSANPIGQLVLEIDGVVMESSFAAFLKGGWLSPRDPFAAKTAEGFNLHFPMLHQHHCRVSVRAESRSALGELFYQIAWSAIEGEVEPFDIDSARVHRKSLKRLSERWKRPPEFALEPCFSGELAAGRSVDAVDLNRGGVARCLRVTADSKTQLAGLWIELFWDGETVPAVSAPLHALCGVSERFEDVRSIPVDVEGATATIRWPMPFESRARVVLVNKGAVAARVKTFVFVEAEERAPRRFRANYSEFKDIDVAAGVTLNLAEISGAGILLGCVLQARDRCDGWWGEGDPILWLDSAERPAWRGTGTEDYFGFAWCSKSCFQHPLRGQTKTGAFYRYHLLDAPLFREWARFDLEARGTGAGGVDYSALVLWYSDTSSRND